MGRRAWHWVHENKLRDGREVPPDGEWLEHAGEVRICWSGLHASYELKDALCYAPGFTLCRVEVADVVTEQYDKLVARRRRVLWRVDAEDCLRKWARWCASQVLDKWDAPESVKRFLASGEGAEEARRDAEAAYAAYVYAAYAANAAAYAAYAAAYTAANATYATYVANAAANAAYAAVNAVNAANAVYYDELEKRVRALHAEATT